jgi:hypothetical protein
MQVARPRSSAAALVTARSGGSVRVDEARMRIARAAVAKLPTADRMLLARHGLRVQLVPTRALEDGMLGATTVVRRDSGRLVPTEIRVASRIEGRGAESLHEVVQHEVGHALAVLRRQDRSEAAAEAYARRW